MATSSGYKVSIPVPLNPCVFVAGHDFTPAYLKIIGVHWGHRLDAECLLYMFFFALCLDFSH